jgi:hypothetical protein
LTPNLPNGNLTPATPPTEWVAIEPEYFEKYGFFQTKHITERRRVETYCCTECGFLESFAVKPEE